MRCRMSVHAHSIYPRIYKGYKNLALYLSAEWRLAPHCRRQSNPQKIFFCSIIFCLNGILYRKESLWSSPAHSRPANRLGKAGNGRGGFSCRVGLASGVQDALRLRSILISPPTPPFRASRQPILGSRGRSSSQTATFGTVSAGVPHLSRASATAPPAIHMDTPVVPPSYLRITSVLPPQA